MRELAKDFKIAYKAQDPNKDFLYTPAILVLSNGRYVMSLDIRDKFGKTLTSDDKEKAGSLEQRTLGSMQVYSSMRKEFIFWDAAQKTRENLMPATL